MKWVCEKCGSTKLGPERPRKDDVCRYCFGCSEEAGRLVERTCPVLEKKRSARAARREVIAERAAARETARWSVGGLDLRVELKRFWKLRAITQDCKYDQVPPLKIQRASNRWLTSGHAKWTGKIFLTLSHRDDPVEAAVVLLHEVVHCALPNEEHHGDLFWSTFAEAARQAWPGTQIDGLYAQRTKAAKHLFIELSVKAAVEGRPYSVIQKESQAAYDKYRTERRALRNERLAQHLREADAATRGTPLAKDEGDDAALQPAQHDPK